MSYEADARRQLISRLRNVYGSQADAYRGGAVREQTEAEKALAQALKENRALQRAIRDKPPLKGKCLKRNKVCVEYRCQLPEDVTTLKEYERAERQLLKDHRSAAAKARPKTAWQLLVSDIWNKEMKDEKGNVKVDPNDLEGADYEYADALREASKRYAKEGNVAKVRAQRVYVRRLPKEKKAKAKKVKKAKKAKAVSAFAIKKGDTVTIGDQTIQLLVKGYKNKSTFDKWIQSKMNPSYNMKDTAILTRPVWNKIKATAQNPKGRGLGMYNPNYGGPGYGAGRSGGVMMDSMYGEGYGGYGDYGGVLMDVFDDYQ